MIWIVTAFMLAMIVQHYRWKRRLQRSTSHFDELISSGERAAAFWKSLYYGEHDLRTRELAPVETEATP